MLAKSAEDVGGLGDEGDDRVVVEIGRHRRDDVDRDCFDDCDVEMVDWKNI